MKVREWLMRVKVNNIIAFFLAATLLFFTKPFFTWFNAYVILIPAILFFLLVFIKGGVVKKELSRNSFLLILLILLIFLPFREFDFVNLYSFLFIFVLFVAFYLKEDVLLHALDIYVYLIFIICLMTIISYIMLIMKVPIPFIFIENEARIDKVFIYFTAVFLDSQIFNINGFNLYRANGWFQEPGHFGIYLVLALIALKQPFSSIRGKIIIFTLLLTFSASAYLLFLLLLLLKNFDFKKIYLVLSVFLLIYLMYMNIPLIRTLLDDIILYKFRTESILDDRTKDIDILGDINLFNYFMGKGSLYLSELDIVVSDYRRFIVTSGYFSFLFLFAFFFGVLFSAIKGKNKVLICLVTIIFVILMHRSWMLYQGFIWIYLTIFLALFESKKFNYKW